MKPVKAFALAILIVLPALAQVSSAWAMDILPYGRPEGARCVDTRLSQKRDQISFAEGRIHLASCQAIVPARFLGGRQWFVRGYFEDKRREWAKSSPLKTLARFFGLEDLLPSKQHLAVTGADLLSGQDVMYADSTMDRKLQELDEALREVGRYTDEPIYSSDRSYPRDNHELEFYLRR